jgi:hypothetical protein
MEEEVFKTSEEFFEWYIPTIEGFVPSLRSYVVNGRHKAIAKRVPKLDDKTTKFMFKKIREITPVPDNVYLVYSPKYQTWASTYNTKKKRLEIIIPTYGYYMLRYPPLIKVAIQHEMGHIFNRDYSVQIEGHGNCVNMAMDCRINAQIDRDHLRDLYDATYYFKQKSFKSIVPEEFYGDISLPLLEGTSAYSWKTIHEYYHYSDIDVPDHAKKPQQKPEKYTQMPVEGDIVQIRKGTKEGRYGRVIDIVNEKAVVEEMTRDEVQEYFDMLEDMAS